MGWLLLLAPVVAFAEAVVYALILFFPVMLVLMWLHPLIPLIPALGWKATFLFIMLVRLVLPNSATVSSS